MATPLFALPPKDPRILQTRLEYLVRVMCQTRLAFRKQNRHCLLFWEWVHSSRTNRHAVCDDLGNVGSLYGSPGFRLCPAVIPVVSEYFITINLCPLPVWQSVLSIHENAGTLE